MADRAAVREQDRQVLEIRVHGIANAPPAEMLEVEASEVRRRIGDDLGSFWVRKDAPDEPARDPDTGVAATEAYSWGALARTGGSAIAVIGRVLVHLGWLFILPFGICNLAYWTRDIPKQDDTRPESWRGGHGAALLRLFALVLTLIYAAAFMTVAVDLVGIQCFDGVTVCAALPSWLDGLNGLDRDGRAAVLSLAPVAAMLVIYLIARSGRVSWEPNLNAFAEKFLGGKAASDAATAAASDAATPAPSTGAGAAGAAAGATERAVARPLLATRGFWTRARTGATSERLHFAGVIALVLLLLSWDGALHPLGAACVGDDDRFVEGGCLSQVFAYGGTPVAAFWIGCLAAALLVGVAVSIITASVSKTAFGDRVKRAIAGVLLGLACAGYVAYLVVALWPPAADAAVDPDPRSPFLGLVVTPTALMVVALGIAFIGGAWGTHASRVLAVTLVSLAGLAFAATGWAPDFGLLLTVMGAVLLVVHFLALIGADASRRRHPHGTRSAADARPFAGDLSVVGWRGFGAMVGMLAALLVSMVVSSLLVLGVLGYLGPAAAGEVAGGRRTPAAEALGPLVPPVAYGRFAVVLTLIVIVLGVFLLVVLGPKFWVLPQFTVPRLDPPETDPDGAPMHLGGVATPPADYPEREPTPPPGPAKRVLTVRRTSQVLHRGEVLLAWLAVLSAAGFLVFASPWGYRRIAEALPEDVRVGVRDASIAILVAVALAAVAAVAATAATKAERPLALFWDIMCFFPRAGHPFAPPCYSERTVPELSGRIRAWLAGDPEGLGEVRDERAVVIAAWSMGGPVAVSAIFALADNELAERSPTVRSIALLTYGSQLRAFFSRFFPSVLGPDDLGVDGVVGPSLFLRDPWQRQVRREWPEAFAGAEPNAARAVTADPTREFTLRSLLGGGTDPGVAREVRWVSLWRRTDPLGFPVHGYRENPIDRGAVERSATSYLWQVAAHGEYPGTAQYAAARAALVRRLGEVPVE